ncbi:unnamed protein product [Linum tenue]|uniref:Pentatricopeptide repeat-containing protein n=1 Tax=Linum tenue TaxID=586396 RepID=A0AAV0HP67_9ROSI|nr:unnamed protein product [Linum tenue]
MKRSAFHSLGRSFQVLSLRANGETRLHCLQFSFRTCLNQWLAFSSSSNVRPFPDYSPKKPTIRDSDLVHQISNAIRLRRSEPLRRVLKPFESKFRSDHLVWVLMSIKNDYKLVLDFFNWACLQRDPNLEARCIVIQIAAACKDLKVADELIRDFWAKPNLEVGHAFTLFVERLIYTYKEWGSDPHVFDVFFHVLAEAGLLAEARSFFDKLLNYGILVSVDSCNQYLSYLSNSTHGLVMTLKVYVEFSRAGVCWNTTSYNIIMSTLCQLARLKEAHTLLLQMEFKGYPPDVVSYSTIINGYCQIGELEEVLHLIEEMQFKGLKPNSYTYNSIILLLFKSGNVDKTETVLKEMVNQGITPDNVVYTTLIDGFCKRGNTQAAYMLFHEMQAQRIIPDFIAYTAIICGFCQNGNMLEADKLFTEMLGRGVRPDEVTYSALVDGYCKLGDMKKAFFVHNQMVRHGLVPNVVTYTTLADGLCKIGELETANELLKEMRAKGLQLNVWTYNSMVNGLCKVGNLPQALQLKEEMEVAGIHPDVVTYTTLMDAYCKMGEMGKASELLQEMLKRGLQPTVVTFNVLMNAFCQWGRLEDGEKLLQWMLDRKIMPNTTTYNCLMKQYSIRNNMHRTTEIYRAMQAEVSCSHRKAIEKQKSLDLNIWLGVSSESWATMGTRGQRDQNNANKLMLHGDILAVELLNLTTRGSDLVALYLSVAVLN